MTVLLNLRRQQRSRFGGVSVAIHLDQSRYLQPRDYRRPLPRDTVTAPARPRLSAAEGFCMVIANEVLVGMVAVDDV